MHKFCLRLCLILWYPDGASVGCYKSVVTRIKALVPNFIDTHYSTHGLPLAGCEASNASTMVKRFEFHEQHFLVRLFKLLNFHLCSLCMGLETLKLFQLIELIFKYLRVGQSGVSIKKG